MRERADRGDGAGEITSARLGDALTELLLVGRTAHPDDVPVVVASSAARLGARDVALYLIDLSQRELVPMHTRRGPAGPSLSIDGTVAGRAFRKETTTTVRRDDGIQAWVPVHDSAERVGVLAMTFDAFDDSVDRATRAFGALTGEFVVSKARYGDAVERTRRNREMTLAAEMRWSLLPPLTYTSPSLTISGLLEPAYDIAGDTFDYAVIDDAAHLAIFDAMGHGLRASRMANLSVCSYRNTRRNGGTLEEMYLALDETIATSFGDSVFVTAAIATLGLSDGYLRWVNAGHPLPLLVRDSRTVAELACPPSIPVGFGGTVRAVGEQQLQPGDTVVFYTDGVVEARGPRGELYGLDRLKHAALRAASSEEPTAETVRRLVASVLDHEHGNLHDDATVLLVTWHGPERG